MKSPTRLKKMSDQSKRLERIEDKVDDVLRAVADVKTDQVEIKADLRYHIRRTDILESMAKRHEKLFYVLLAMMMAGGAEKLGVIHSIVKALGF